MCIRDRCPTLHTITTYFEYRWGSFHSALDISGGGAYGQPILASDNGTVTAADYSGSYGYRVIIDHANGMKTPVSYTHLDVYKRQAPILLRSREIARLCETRIQCIPMKEELKMKKIASFCVNHDTLTPGIYLSRVDGPVATYAVSYTHLLSHLRCRVPFSPASRVCPALRSSGIGA